jgi:hypothetical protein
MSHAAVIHAVCECERKLVFPEYAPEGYVSLATVCMDHDPAARPTFDDIVDILTPLAALASGGDPVAAGLNSKGTVIGGLDSKGSVVGGLDGKVTVWGDE